MKRRLPLESEMALAIKDAVEHKGGRCWFARDSRRQNLTDLPDLIILLPDRGNVVFIELKSQRRRITDGQAAVIELLERCHDVDAFIVRPEPREGELGYERILDWIGRGM